MIIFENVKYYAYDTIGEFHSSGKRIYPKKNKQLWKEHFGCNADCIGKYFNSDECRSVAEKPNYRVSPAVNQK